MLGYPLALHFNLSHFTSTERGWHQDDYMCDPQVAASGVAMWFALDTIHVDSGPFEFVPRSHQWPTMRREKVTQHLKRDVYENTDGKYEFWAHIAEYFVNPACDSYIKKKNARAEFFMAEKGDVLIWHGGLMHRGSHPRNPKISRPSLIAHYCDPQKHPVAGGKLTFHNNDERYISFPDAPKTVIKGGNATLHAPFLLRIKRKIKKIIS